MSTPEYVVALDQGTTSSRAVVYDGSGKTVSSFSVPLNVACPQDGWVEQDAREIFRTQLEALRGATQGIDAKTIRALGITNQRETTVCWERKSGEPVAPAIVWQCRRSAEICARFRKEGHASNVRDKTGLVLDPYFSATKIVWLQENTPGLRERAKRGEVLYGTIDSWVLYCLTEGRSFFTEPTNASRTMLYSLRDGRWDAELLQLFDVQEENLAVLRPSHGEFGVTRVLGPEIPICAVMGDQQASLFGHGCFSPSSVKCTFGTGAFLLINTGVNRIESEAGLISTALWSSGLEQGNSDSKETLFALEGSIFMAGALVQWLRDKLGVIASSAESESLARSVSDTAGVVVVPAFTGLGAPYWDTEAREAILGLTREAGKAHLVRAALDAVAHQVADLLDLPELSSIKSVSVDGGMIANQLFCQRLADLTGKEIRVSENRELTAFGVASLAAFSCGVLANWGELAKGFRSVPSGTNTIIPAITMAEREEQRSMWKRAVGRVVTT